MALIGIDLGTTNSLAAIWRDGVSLLIPNALGSVLTPSVVSIGDNGEIIVGESAKERLVTHPERTASLFKQHMGSTKTYKIAGRSFSPEDLSSFILRSLKESAEAFLRDRVTEAVISVPAYFSDSQRFATKLAGQLAGLKVERIINEPSAAAMAYRQLSRSDETNIVIDFGGGTLDVSIVEAFENIVDIISVSGDNHLGGSDIDEAIMSAFLAKNLYLAGRLSLNERGTLLRVCEKAKITLSTETTAEIILHRSESDYSMTLDDQTLAEICSPLFQRIENAIKHALKDSQRSINSISNTILVGGSCNMPLIQRFFKYVTGKDPLIEVEPDYAVAIGVAVVAGIKERNKEIRDLILTDICPFTLGTSVVGDRMSPIIERNTALPNSNEQTYTTVFDNQTEIRFGIYQGESFDARLNTKLGEIIAKIPALPAGQATITARFSYDINGILDVELKSRDTGEKWNLLIVNNTKLSQDEVESRVSALQKLKIASNAADDLLIAKGKRIFEENTGSFREIVGNNVQKYIDLLKGGKNPAQIAKYRRFLTNFLNEADTDITGMDLRMDYDFDSFEDDDCFT